MLLKCSERTYLFLPSRLCCQTCCSFHSSLKPFRARGRWWIASRIMLQEGQGFVSACHKYSGPKQYGHWSRPSSNFQLFRSGRTNCFILASSSKKIVKVEKIKILRLITLGPQLLHCYMPNSNNRPHVFLSDTINHGENSNKSDKWITTTHGVLQRTLYDGKDLSSVPQKDKNGNSDEFDVARAIYRLDMWGHNHFMITTWKENEQTEKLHRFCPECPELKEVQPFSI